MNLNPLVLRIRKEHATAGYYLELLVIPVVVGIHDMLSSVEDPIPGIHAHLAASQYLPLVQVRSPPARATPIGWPHGLFAGFPANQL